MKTRRWNLVIVSLLGVVVLLFSVVCAPKTTPAPVPQASPTPAAPAPRATPAPVAPAPAPPAPARPAWQARWDTLVADAKKEGKLTIYGDLGSAVSSAFRKGFGEKYGISVETMVGRGGELRTKIQAERKAGIYAADLSINGAGSDLAVWVPMGALQDLDDIIFRPDVLDEKLWWGGSGPFYGPYMDKEHLAAGAPISLQVPITYNTEMVKPGEITSFNDLLDPRWKGKILMGDPTTSGSAQGQMEAALLIMGEDYIKKLAGQVALMTRDKRLLVEWVARGSYPIAFGASGDTRDEFHRAGAKVGAVAPKEGCLLQASGMAIMFTPAPHPNAAGLFLHWWLSKEGQEVWAKAVGMASRRLDVSAEHVLPELRVKPGIDYIAPNDVFYATRSERLKVIEKHYKVLR